MSLDNLLEALAVPPLRRWSGVVPMIGATAFGSRASLSGVWPPNCTMTPTGFPVDDFGTSSSVRAQNTGDPEVS